MDGARRGGYSGFRRIRRSGSHHVVPRRPNSHDCARSKPLRGTVTIPGDKSVSHRSLILGALAIGATRVTGLLEGQDVLDTAGAMRALGAEVNRSEDCVWSIHGVGVGGFAEPEDVIDCGNSGTGCG